MIWNKLIKQWIKISPTLWSLLDSLTKLRRGIKQLNEYTNSLPSENILDNVELYIEALDIMSGIKRNLRFYSNEFNIAHKGVSLN